MQIFGITQEKADRAVTNGDRQALVDAKRHDHLGLIGSSYDAFNWPQVFVPEGELLALFQIVCRLLRRRAMYALAALCDQGMVRR